MRILAAVLLATLLSGCGAAPWWATIASGVFGWAASVNNLGTEIIKVEDEKKAPPPDP